MSILQNPFCQLVNRRITVSSSLFKIKPLGQDQIVISAPSNKLLATLSLDLKSIDKIIKLDEKPLAIEVIDYCSNVLIAAGCSSGAIYLIPYQNQQFKWILQPSNEQEVFVNDIVSYDAGILANCYNNGNIGIWGVSTGQRIHTFQKVHHQYTYKLRKGQNNTLISCGADGNVVRIDLQRGCQISRYFSPQPIWCASQVAHNTIASIGLSPRLSIWDTRVDKTVQYCNLEGVQSSFVISKLDYLLYFGRNNVLFKWDRRKADCQLLSNQVMFQSVESIHLHNEGLIACGRGSDISSFRYSANLQTLSPQQQFERSSKLYLQPSELNGDSEYEIPIVLNQEDDIDFDGESQEQWEDEQMRGSGSEQQFLDSQQKIEEKREKMEEKKQEKKKQQIDNLLDYLQQIKGIEGISLSEMKQKEKRWSSKLRKDRGMYQGLKQMDIEIQIRDNQQDIMYQISEDKEKKQKEMIEQQMELEIGIEEKNPQNIQEGPQIQDS